MPVADPTVFVIDDQKSVREALMEMLSVFGFTVEAYESADTFLTKVDLARHGCVVADVRMPGTDGIALVRELARRKSPLPVILISGHADVPMAVAGIKAGAQDFIEKPVDDAQLVAAINRGFARTLAEQTKQQSQEALAQRFARLTPRQIEVFDLVVKGLTSQAIADELAISIRTVESYRVQVMEKMQAESVAVPRQTPPGQCEYRRRNGVANFPLNARSSRTRRTGFSGAGDTRKCHAGRPLLIALMRATARSQLMPRWLLSWLRRPRRS
jgi:two-component system response regulator FixJ